MSNPVIALLCADLHLSDKAPLARRGEPNWLAAQERQLKQLSRLQEKYDCPVLIAGDLFDRWNPSPVVINFALDEMPRSVYAIPGQHDLFCHRYSRLGDTAFGTLIKARRLTEIQPGRGFGLGGFEVFGFPWGIPLKPCSSKSHRMKAAVVHAYCWHGTHKYAGADMRSNIHSYAENLAGYNVSVWGDNHLHWSKLLK